MNETSVTRGHGGWGRRVGAMLALTSLIAIGAGALTAPSTPAGAADTSPDKLIVYTTYGAPGQSATGTVVGHAYVDLVDTESSACKPTACHHIYGKYPGGSWPFDTDGSIKSDSNSGWSWRITYKLNDDQYKQALYFVNNEIAHPSRYKVLSTNCMEWAAEVAAKAGVRMQPYKNGLGVPEPAIFRNSLENLGSGSTPGDTGGLVLKNNNPGSSASGAPDPPSPTPPCCDADSIVAAAMNHPATVAGQLGLQFSSKTLAADHPDADGTYRVVIRRADRAGNLYGIIWGDGKRTTLERPSAAGTTVTFKHTYQGPVTGPLRVIIVENGQITEFVRPLANAHRGSGHGENDAEPTPPPQHFYS